MSKTNDPIYDNWKAWKAAVKSLCPQFEIIIRHSNYHDGMVDIINGERTPLGDIVITLDELKEALEEAGYKLVEIED